MQVKKYRGRGLHFRPEQLLKPKITIHGYRQVVLCKNKVRRYYGIHQLVAIAFIPNAFNKLTVNHINCDKSDNHFENLEWATSKEQIDHAYLNGLMPRGEQCGQSKITELQVKEIRNSKLTARKLAPKYGLYWSTIQKIKNKETWKYVV